MSATTRVAPMTRPRYVPRTIWWHLPRRERRMLCRAQWWGAVYYLYQRGTP